MTRSRLTLLSAILCSLLGLSLFAASAEARAINNNDDCWTANITACCNGYTSTLCSDGTYDPSCAHFVCPGWVGWGEGGGPTLDTCNDALTQLLNDAAWAGCIVQPGSPQCTSAPGACSEEPPPLDG